MEVEVNHYSLERGREFEAERPLFQRPFGSQPGQVNEVESDLVMVEEADARVVFNAPDG